MAGPSQTDTFDLKPNHENGGEFDEIATSAPGVRISEHLPALAKMADRLAIIRSLVTKEGDHGRGSYLVRTGRMPMGDVRYPCIGSALARELGESTSVDLPPYVSIGSYRSLNPDAFGPGFLGPRYGPLIVGATDVVSTPSVATSLGGYPELRVESLDRAEGISAPRMQERLRLWNHLQAGFLRTHTEGPPKTQQAVYDGALRLMNGNGADAFDLGTEPDSLRQKYGQSVFGQGCLLARRLVERGVSFVEVSLGTTSGGAGWDTHSDNFKSVRDLSAQLDAGWSTLMTDLDERGLLDSTTILWMGEFGRTPRINNNSGRDHFPTAWSCVLAGGGIAGGSTWGTTTADGMDVSDNPTTIEDVLATTVAAVKIAPETHQMSNTGRPVPIADGTPIQALLT